MTPSLTASRARLRTPATVVTAGILRSDLGTVLARQAIASRNVLRCSEGSMLRDLIALTFSALLFGAAVMANVSDGPMREHRGSWVTHALR
jgi:hypothetical protein